MNVLLVTDAFPPNCGGSGWSTYELARGLRHRGHRILVVQPQPGTPEVVTEASYDGLRVLQFGSSAPNVPFVRNYFKSERLHGRLSAFLTQLVEAEHVDLVHGQHVMTCLPAIEAAHAAGIPAVCTVRDYWPVCYWSDLIHTKDEAALCPACSAGAMTQCIRPRAGALWPAALPLIPYMRANLATKREGLAGADAVIAVSSTIASDLRARAPELASTRIEIIPNAVDIRDIVARAARSAPLLTEPYAFYLGKIARNKGTSHLVDVIRDADLDWPLVVAGDGPEKAALEAEAARAGRDIRFVGWVDKDAATAWLAHASILIFPSRGPESLSRVLIEASALARPIAAMNTGGTPDIVRNEETGLLSDTPRQLAADVRRLRLDADLRTRLGDGARRHAEAQFDAPAVMARIENLYEDVLSRRSQ